VLSETQTITLQETITYDGTGTVSSTTYLDPSNYTIVAQTSPFAGAPSGYFVYAPYSYPSTDQAGDTGTLATGTIYSDSTMANQIGTFKLTYSVAAGSANSLQVTFAWLYANSTSPGDQITYQVDSNGNATLLTYVNDGTAIPCMAGSSTVAACASVAPETFTYTFE